jgi:hypothetical protein
MGNLAWQKLGTTAAKKPIISSNLSISQCAPLQCFATPQLHFPIGTSKKPKKNTAEFYARPILGHPTEKKKALVIGKK